jgi:hypothetical protein
VSELVKEGQERIERGKGEGGIYFITSSSLVELKKKNEKTKFKVNARIS